MTNNANENAIESENASSRRRVAVLGGGISGLAAAWRLSKIAPELDVVLWEKTGRVGGVIGSKQIDGFHLEASVDNFITTVPWALDLCKELGFEQELTSTNNRYRRTFVVRKRRLYPLPDGFMTMAPTKLYPMATTPLLSPFGKLRCALELLLPRRRSQEEESIAAFVTRRLGREAFERLVEPLVGGIYGGDASRLSLQATLPRFAEMERKDRSLIWSMKKSQKKAKKVKREEESGARYSFFLTLSSGMESLPRRLAERLESENRARVELNREAVKLEKAPGTNDADGGWLLTDSTGQTERFDAVLCATPSDAAGALFRSVAPITSEVCAETERTGTAIVHLAFRNEQVKRPVAGMGFVVPPSEGNGLLAGSFSSFKYPSRAPEGTTLLRIFVGGARSPDSLTIPESELLDRVLTETRALLGVEGEPLMSDVARFPNAMPQYYLGRLDAIRRLREELDATPTLALAGNALAGVGLPACVKSGNDAAEKIAADLGISAN
ncbi:MAG: protoporphyrinogen oxidase [Thermoguttaceae bacterium]|nr:protoporphyrinogen oxidase [Thermoguttaceae bacterium]